MDRQFRVLRRLSVGEALLSPSREIPSVELKCPLEYRTNVKLLLGFILLACCLSGHGLFAQQNHDKTVRMTAVVQESPVQITLNWLAPSSGAYTISHQKLYRRLAGAAWGAEYASLATGDLTYLDANVETGVLYEYRVVRLFSNGPRSSTGYLEAGVHLREVDRRGSVILLVRDTAATAMATELTRLQEDLAGDGWHVIREDITGAQTVTEVKAVVEGHFNSPSTPNVRSVFIFGRVPVPYSGLIAPDGHSNHIGAWPADVFYGELDGIWTDTEIDDTGASGTRNDNIPGDGKYDQSILPSPMELEVGRVDMANMTIFPDSGTSETDLLLRYLNKNHDYRHLQGNYASIPRRGLMDGGFLTYRGEDTFASNPWWNFTAFFGAGNVSTSDWFSTLDTEKYLWAFGGGGGSFVSAGGVGTSTDFGTTDSKAVFCMMLGSYFGDWDSTNNFLRAPLAGTTDGLGLANMWAGRPHWHIHSMAMGETLGHGTRVTQNNTDDYSTGFGATQVHIALMGDPTLRLFPVLPASSLTQASSSGAVALSWTASTDANIQGYAIYRGATDARTTGLFSRVNGALVTGNSFNDLSGVPGTPYTYMIRAVKLETSSSGTYRNSSQGVFIDAFPAAVIGPEISISGNGEPIQSGSTTALTENETDSGSGEINLDVVSRTFTIKNDGTTDLTLSGASPVSLSGTLAADYSVTIQPLGVLTSGSSTTFQIQFSPTALGMKEAVVSLSSDDADEGVFTFAIEGRGTPNLPDISIAATSFNKTLAVGASDSDTLSITNNGIGDLDFEISPEYAFRDSDHPSGPTYDWIDISTVGTKITSWSGSGAPTDNGGSESIAIGFNFPFYGTNQTTLRVSTEGFLIFGSWVDAPSNAPVLPSLSAPQNMIAIYWDDLDLRSSFDESAQGKVYFLQIDPDTFIVQFEGVYQYSSTPTPGDERLTCQAILKSSGEIILHYKSVPTTTHYLVGIQDENLDRGLTVTANSAAISDLMAVRILPPIDDSWLTLSETSGTTMTTLTSDITMTCDLAGLPFGDYFGLLHLTSNDPDTPLIMVDLEIEGGDETPEIELTGNGNPIPYQTTTAKLGNDTYYGLLPANAPTQTKTYTILNAQTSDLTLGTLTLTGSDFTLTQPASTALGAGLSTTFTVTFPTGLATGTYTSAVTVPSDDANEPNSTFVVEAVNMTPIEEWRLDNFGDLSNTTPGNNEGDPDGDGLNNLSEYALGGNPNSVDSGEVLPSYTLDGSGRVQVHFKRDPAKTDLTYTVQASSTLEDLGWTDIATSILGAATTSTPGGAFSVTESGSPLTDVTVTDSGAAPTSRFLRLKISIP